MILNKWYPILESKEVKKNKPFRTKRLGVYMVLWRDESGKINCINDRCLHRGASLGAGKVKDGNIQCPFHGIEYNGNGECCLIPANGKSANIPDNYKIKHYETKEVADMIWIWWGDTKKKYPEINFFDDITKDFSYSRYKEIWTTHYTRCIENQLDAVHVPFVHYNTIGRGGRTIINGPYVKMFDDKDEMKIWVYSEKDTGQVNKKSNELAEPDEPYRLHFKFPNIWQNRIADALRAVLFFVPVDDENTMIYMRFYQKFMKIPLLKGLLNKLFMAFNKVVLHQDRRVVLTQLPKRTHLKMGERLIAGDIPIIQYRKRHDELIAKNNQE